MIGKVEQRRKAKVAAIVARAWDLASEHGIAGVSLHALARAVGMRQPSLYAYFDSKHALYDAMFADGNLQLLARLDDLALPKDPRAALTTFMGAFVDFAVSDLPRAALLFQRPIPGFAPSPESYGYAREVLDRTVAVLRAAGVDDPDDVDCYIAMVGGVIDAQISNDPGGDRWTRHLERLSVMYLDQFTHGRNH